jgi:NAD(P)-dependent dehydrogenase (short-subunit alcohol dehydrogenase family)
MNRFRLDGKVAIVTGASKGIGAAIAHGLAEFGAAVVVSSRKQDAVDAVAAEITDAGFHAVGRAAHMGDLDDVATLVNFATELFGGIDIVVNNAAANPVFGPIQHTDQRAFAKIIEVNLQGPFELCKLAYPSMKARGGGSVINISSIGGIKPERMIGMYSASKAALISMTQAMAQDWGADNIRANAVCPGLIKTKFSAALWQNDAILDQFLQHIPLGRIGSPEDVAALAVFLASDAAAYCTGGVYLVDGGYLAA